LSASVKVGAVVGKADSAGRIELDRYFMTLAWVVSLRSTCRARHGAVVVERGHIVSTGYNGSLPGEAHCTDIGCQMRQVRERERCVRTKHAEDNALRRARGRGDTIYTTGKPCWECWGDIVSSGHVRRVVWWREYPDDLRDEYWSAYEGPIVRERFDVSYLTPQLEEYLIHAAAPARDLL
jgi:dCMP deaminase